MLANGCRNALSQLTGSAGATKAEREDAHGHDTAAFSAVDVGVVGEDVGDGLRGVGLEGHCEVCLGDAPRRVKCGGIKLSVVYQASAEGGRRNARCRRSDVL